LTGLGDLFKFNVWSFAVPAAIISGSILLVSLLSTVLVFPLVFQYGMDPAQGTELVFDVLESGFAQRHSGSVFVAPRRGGCSLCFDVSIVSANGGV